MEAKHSPLPWAIEEENVAGGCNISSGAIRVAHTSILAKVWKPGQRLLHEEEAKANAALIVHAVNNIDRITAERNGLADLAKFVTDHWDNQDMNHADFRVRAYQIATALSSLPAQEGWREIESAPKDRDILVVCANGTSMLVVCWDDDYTESHPWTNGHEGFHRDSFSHWQPLPTPPSADQGGEK